MLIPMFNFYMPLFLYPMGCLCIYYLSGYYLRPLRKNYWRELRRTFGSATIISLVAFFLSIIDDPIGGNYQRYIMSLVALFLIHFAALKTFFRDGFVASALRCLDKDKSIHVDFYYISSKALSSEFLMDSFLKNVIILGPRLKATSF